MRLNGLHFWGSPFSAKHKRRSSNGAFQYKEEFQRTRLWRYVPNDVDVLLTHGSATEVPLLAATIERTAPYVHAHGHDHELHGATLEWPPEQQAQGQQGLPREGQQPQGQAQRPQLITVNAAICNKHYEPLQLPIVVDLPACPSSSFFRPSPKAPPVSLSYDSSVGNGGGAAAQKARVAAVAAPGGSRQPHEQQQHEQQQPQKRRQQPQQRRQQQQQWRKQQQEAQGGGPQAGAARGRGSGKAAVKATSSAKAAASAAKSLHTAGKATAKATVNAAAKATVKAAAKAGAKVAAKAAVDVQSVATKAEFRPWWQQRKARRRRSKRHQAEAELNQAEAEAA